MCFGQQKPDDVIQVGVDLDELEDTRQPKCQEEKEVAIRKALEYFRMV